MSNPVCVFNISSKIILPTHPCLPHLMHDHMMKWTDDVEIHATRPSVVMHDRHHMEGCRVRIRLSKPYKKIRHNPTRKNDSISCTMSGYVTFSYPQEELFRHARRQNRGTPQRNR